MLALKVENQKLKEKIDQNDNKSIDVRYLAHHQASTSVSRKSSERILTARCEKCKNMCEVYQHAEQQMKVGKEQLEESANIVEEVTLELRAKDEEIQKITRTLNVIAKLFRPDGDSTDALTLKKELSVENLLIVSFTKFF